MSPSLVKVKAIAIIISIALSFMTLVACSQSGTNSPAAAQLTVSQPSAGHLVFSASSSTTESALSTLVVPEGQGVAIDASVSSGEFQVEVLSDAEGVPYCNAVFATSDTMTVPEAHGTCAIRVEATSAIGNIKVYICDPSGGEVESGADADSNEGAPDMAPGQAAHVSGIAEFSAPVQLAAGDIVFSSPVYSSEGDAAVATYDNGGARLVLKKSLVAKGEQLSKDERETSEEWTVMFASGEAVCHGVREKGACRVVWDSNGYHYSVSVFGANDQELRMSEGDVAAVISAVQ